MKEGEIVEQGSYDELFSKEGEFARLMTAYGGIAKEVEEEEVKVAADIADEVIQEEHKEENAAVDKEVKEKKALMTIEERYTGAVKGKMYLTYARAAGGLVFGIFAISVIAFSQGLKVYNDIFLVFWLNSLTKNTSSTQYDLTKDQYTAIYVTMGFVAFLFSET